MCAYPIRIAEVIEDALFLPRRFGRREELKSKSDPVSAVLKKAPPVSRENGSRLRVIGSRQLLRVEELKGTAHISDSASYPCRHFEGILS